jgi:hypothetical protein
MIIEPTFLTHWKTTLLKQRLQDDKAPLYVIALWSYCQTSRKAVLDIPHIAIASVCGYAGESETLVNALVECRFLDRDGERLTVHEWNDYNGKLVSNWENGRRGGRPKGQKENRDEPDGNPQETQNENGLTHEEPNTDLANPSETHGEPTDNPRDTQNGFGEPTPNRLDKTRLDKSKNNSPLPPLNGGHVGETVSSSNGKPEHDRQRTAWTAETGWTGTEADLPHWTEAYPACDVSRQLAAMDAWLRANPKRAHKANWDRFIVNWLTKQQDRGGDVRSNTLPKPAGSEKPLSTWEIKERLQACQSELNDLLFPGGCAYAVELTGAKLERANKLKATIRELKSGLTNMPHLAATNA